MHEEKYFSNLRSELEKNGVLCKADRLTNHFKYLQSIRGGQCQDYITKNSIFIIRTKFFNVAYSSTEMNSFNISSFSPTGLFPIIHTSTQRASEGTKTYIAASFSRADKISTPGTIMAAVEPGNLNQI